ncbi:hypothetical protein CPB86DRAFT_819760 [Serendipita vermifera]|nr:hypothetical protein CPB86DRAFT_819760 [Serendipita vermifera]
MYLAWLQSKVSRVIVEGVTVEDLSQRISSGHSRRISPRADWIFNSVVEKRRGGLNKPMPGRVPSSKNAHKTAYIRGQLRTPSHGFESQCRETDRCADLQNVSGVGRATILKTLPALDSDVR